MLKFENNGYSDSGGGGGKGGGFFKRKKDDERVPELRKAVYTILEKGQKGEDSRKAYQVIVSEKTALLNAVINKKSVDVERGKEVIRALKQTGLNFHKESSEYLIAIRDVCGGNNQPILQKAAEDALGEIRDLIKAMENRDLGTIEKYALEKEDWTVMAIGILARMPDSVPNLARIVSKQDVGKDALELALNGLFLSEDRWALMKVIKDAEKQKHPLLDFMVKCYSNQIIIINVDRKSVIDAGIGIPVIDITIKRMTLKKKMNNEGKRVTVKAIVDSFMKHLWGSDEVLKKTPRDKPGIGRFIGARERAALGDFSELERLALEKTEVKVEAGSALGLMGRVESLNRIALDETVDVGMLYVALYGIMRTRDGQNIINIIKKAEEQRHPLFSKIIEYYGTNLLLRTPEGDVPVQEWCKKMNRHEMTTGDLIDVVDKFDKKKNAMWN
jgi:hypothetical protein